MHDNSTFEYFLNLEPCNVFSITIFLLVFVVLGIWIIYLRKRYLWICSIKQAPFLLLLNDSILHEGRVWGDPTVHSNSWLCAGILCSIPTTLWCIVWWWGCGCSGDNGFPQQHSQHLLFSPLDGSTDGHRGVIEYREQVEQRHRVSSVARPTLGEGSNVLIMFNPHLFNFSHYKVLSTTCGYSFSWSLCTAVKRDRK